MPINKQFCSLAARVAMVSPLFSDPLGKGTSKVALFQEDQSCMKEYSFHIPLKYKAISDAAIGEKGVFVSTAQADEE